ncbi:MAG: exopolysaccharide biosynthesis protein [Zhengella sp.]|uniref:exopolysaccharide biosynthesis protein n=1 Tax=Zhengella sp. TaxID=2282762 RepID=UPI001E129146|nr:exopolysaccharide biosynthesis protein [Notoacmeibacter sp.]MCC0026149.1 exopolysaccharide biosynthesis protein [Brucellaceae bacterium]
MSDSQPLVTIIDETCAAATGESTTVAEALDGLGHMSHAALVLLPALVVVTPLSGIPGLSSLLGITIGLVSLQMIAGRRRLWLPKWILRQEVGSRKLVRTLRSLRKPAGFADRLTRERLSWLVRPPARLLLQVLCMICGFAMPFLEVIPFSSSILGGAIAAFATAILARDGLLAAIGLVLAGATVTVAIAALH